MQQSLREGACSPRRPAAGTVVALVARGLWWLGPGSIDLLCAAGEWLATRVIARICALPGLWALAVAQIIRRARRRHELDLIQETALREIGVALACATAPFLELQRAIERIDREHARLEPHFAETLVAARAVHRAIMDELPRLATSPQMHALIERLLAELADAPRDDA